jgi:hypothetical protein
LTAKLRPSDSYTLVANQSSKDAVYGEVVFKPEQLTPGYVVFDNQHVQVAAGYKKRPDSEFGCG